MMQGISVLLLDRMKLYLVLFTLLAMSSAEKIARDCCDEAEGCDENTCTCCPDGCCPAG